MNQPFTEEHWTDTDGNPAGGVSYGTGFAVSWQNGPLGRGDERREPNGAFVETMLGVVKGRLEFYETAAAGRFACDENKAALACIQSALNVLDGRTKAREERGVEGTHGK